MAEPKYTDGMIAGEIDSGRLPTANTHIAHRQMLALESIAASLIKLANPNVIYTNKEALQGAAAGGLGVYVTGQTVGLSDISGASRTPVYQGSIYHEKEQVALRPDADTDLDEPPLDAA